ncbi:hypothetical protein [Sphingosinicella terrae]|uniref:hypothetical protein n=1 Tax=Sphingosinicella terrae TaxID=2172047 RepID=UPI000E0D64D6|nr:hypothetical protein [Sphingosinicella terrae]
MSAAAEPAFTVPLSRAMRRAGLRGAMAQVRLEGDILVLGGDGGGTLALVPGDVTCIRIASYPGRHRPTGYETRIWRRQASGSLAIVPMNHAMGGYGPVMRRFAGWVFADGGSVLRGPSLPALLFQMAWTVGGIALIALLLLGGAIAEGLWWMWLIVALFAGLAVLLFVGLRRAYWPRRVIRPEQLDEFLPLSEENR